MKNKAVASQNKDYDEEHWIYKSSDDKRFRFILGERGNHPLIVFGVNPSRAVPEDLDNTMKNVKRFSRKLGYDGYIMLNLYPQKATNPNTMDDEMDTECVKENYDAIEAVLSQGKCTVWAAWGTLIEKKRYLRECLKKIVSIAGQYETSWIRLGCVTKKGHPHHPLYLPANAEVADFDIQKYCSKICK